MTATRDIFGSLPTPDSMAAYNVVGDSEYRLIHEHVANVLDSAEPAVAPDANADEELSQIIVASLEEVIAAARLIQRSFTTAAAESSIEREALALDAMIDEILADRDNVKGRARKAAEVHANLHKLNERSKAMPPGEPRERARAALHRAARRLLMEVFGLSEQQVDGALQ
jgi:hypothetical protein